MADRTEKPEIKEIATSRDGRDITRGWLSALMHAPVDDRVLLEQGGGDYTLYEDILRDDHVRAAVNQRIYGVIAKPLEVSPGGKRAIDTAAADFMRNQVDELGLDQVTLQMLHGVFYGFSVAEAIWQKKGGRIVLGDLRVRNRRRFAFDGEGRLRLKTYSSLQPGELMPDRKFWVARFGADHHDAPYGLGLAHYLYWPVWLKRNVTRFWAVYLEKFGTPSAVGNYPPQTPKHEQDRLLAALQAMQRDSATVIPQGMEVALVEALRSSAADHKVFVDTMNEAILMICLGQTGTSKGTLGKLGADGERERVKDAIIKTDSDLLSETFNRTIVTWLTGWNFPNATAPRIYRVFSDEDLDARIERDEKIANIGYRPTLRYVQETYGGEWIDAVPPQPSPQAPTRPNQSTDTPGGEFREPDEGGVTPTDLLTDAMETQTGPAWVHIMDEIKTLVDQAESLPELRDALLDAYGGLPSETLMEIMAMGFAAAELSGRYDVNEET